MQITGMDITSRYEHTVRFDVTDAPGFERMDVQHVTDSVLIKWTWTAKTGGFTSREITLYGRRVLKNGTLSQITNRTSMFGDAPEWLAATIAELTPEGYRDAVRESRRMREAERIARGA